MTNTMRSVLIYGAKRYLAGEMTIEDFERGLVLAVAEFPEGKEKDEGLKWLAIKLTS